MSDAIAMNKLTKAYGPNRVVDEVSLKIKRGEVFGLLGPNGAGKTTTISMLCTLRTPTSGTASVWGHDLARQKDAVRHSIGLVFQDPSLDDELTGRENLDFHGRLYGMPAAERRQRIAELAKLVELENKMDTQVKTYSGGMKRRLEIIRGLMHFPKILFLDEPTLGLDPQTRRKLWEYIKHINETKKVTIILTTHYMEEADVLCDRIGIIDHGKIIALDTPARLKETLGGDIVTIELADSKRLLPFLQKESYVRSVHEWNSHLNVVVKNGKQAIPAIMACAQKHHMTVRSVALKQPTLEDVFIKVTGRSMRDEDASEGDRAKNMWRVQKSGR